MHIYICIYIYIYITLPHQLCKIYLSNYNDVSDSDIFIILIFYMVSRTHRILHIFYETWLQTESELWLDMKYWHPELNVMNGQDWSLSQARFWLRPVLWGARVTASVLISLTHHDLPTWLQDSPKLYPSTSTSPGTDSSTNHSCILPLAHNLLWSSVHHSHRPDAGP